MGLLSAQWNIGAEHASTKTCFRFPELCNILAMSVEPGKEPHRIEQTFSYKHHNA